MQAKVRTCTYRLSAVFASIAQLAERLPSKQEATGSIPVARSKKKGGVNVIV